MKHVWCLSLGFIVFILAGTPPHANGSTQDLTDIYGSWAFETDTYRYGECKMTGLAHIVPGDDRQSHICYLTVAEQCADETLTVLQACSARQFGDNLIIRSEIIEMSSQNPDDVAYFADNFQLKIINEASMKGRLISASEAKVEFKRSSGGIS